MKKIIDQNSIISLRILDWFITNYSKKIRTKIEDNDIDVYCNYRLMLKSYSKRFFDPFNRKNKIIFYYTDKDYLETSCGQLLFFKWCFANGIIEYVKNNLDIIELDMKESLKNQKIGDSKRRKPLSIPISRSISKQHVKYTIKFD